MTIITLVVLQTGHRRIQMHSTRCAGRTNMKIVGGAAGGCTKARPWPRCSRKASLCFRVADGAVHSLRSGCGRAKLKTKAVAEIVRPCVAGTRKVCQRSS